MTLRPPPSLGLVIPCYNEAEVLPETSRQLAGVIDALIGAGRITAARVYFVDDGSRDATWALIEAAHAADPRLGGVRLARNRGHQAALLAGLSAADEEVVVTLDADLQDDTQVIGAMVDAWRGGAEIVLGVRSDRRTDSWFKRTTAQAYYGLLARLGVEIVADHADYRLMGRRARAALAEYREVNLFLRALVPQLGFSVATVPYVRNERFAGTSKYPLARMLGFALEGITSFSTRPLRLITAAGVIVSLGSFALALWALATAIVWHGTVPGWASTVVPIYFICGVQLLCTGIIGEYIGKIYLETKQRPRFIIDRLLTDASAQPTEQRIKAGA